MGSRSGELEQLYASFPGLLLQVLSTASCWTGGPCVATDLTGGRRTASSLSSPSPAAWAASRSSCRFPSRSLVPNPTPQVSAPAFPSARGASVTADAWDLAAIGEQVTAHTSL
jgi:hypothetical protein